MTTIEDIERLAAELAQVHGELVAEVVDMNGEIETVKAAHRSALRAKASETSEAYLELFGAIDRHPELFEKPKSRVLAGIKCGFRKKKGKVTMRDEAKTIGLIRKLLPKNQAALLVRRRESVDRNAVSDLTIADLKRVGIQVTDDFDEVVIQPPDAAIARQAQRLIDDADRGRAA